MNPMRRCQDCEAAAVSRGFCGRHYQARRKAGTLPAGGYAPRYKLGGYAGTPAARARALALRLEGKTYAEIARLMGASRQRIQQLVQVPAAAKLRALSRAGYACQRCGATGKDARLDIHHKRTDVPSGEDYNHPRNLVVLCQPCHRRAHRWVP